MTRKKTLTMASVLALALGAGMAQAQDHAPRGPGMMPDFATLDSDGDGKITREEMQAHRLGRVQAMDPDGDGFVTLEEMKSRMGEAARARAEAQAERIFAAIDADGDGRISAAEALAAGQGRGHGARGGDPARLFDRLDRDSDGAISKDEFDRAARHFAERGGKRHGEMRREGRPGAGHPERRPAPAQD